MIAQPTHGSTSSPCGDHPGCTPQHFLFHPLTALLQLLLQYGANPFLSVKRGIFKGRLAIDFVLTAKSKEATALLLGAMQQPHGWPVAGALRAHQNVTDAFMFWRVKHEQ
jgi:hypothetical protein